MNRGNSFAVKINEALNERVCTYRNVNIEKLRNLNFKYRRKTRQKWQLFKTCCREKPWKKAVAGREALYNFQASIFAAAGRSIIMHHM